MVRNGMRLVSQSDVAWIYRLVLGRVHESEERLTERAGKPLAKLLSDFFQSSEFRTSVTEKIERGTPLEETRDALPEGLLDWVKASLALEASSISLLDSVDSWSSLYSVLFSDAAFLASFESAANIFSDDAKRFLARTAEDPERFVRVGAVDEVTAGGVRGWSVNPRAPDRSSTVELWVDGDFVAAAPVDRFRRDIQDRFGGEGRVGFFIETPHGLPDQRAHRLDIIDGPSGRVLQRIERAARSPSPTPAQLLKKELDAVRAGLVKIEARMAAEDRNDPYDPQAYPAYYEAAYREGSAAHPLARSDDAPVTVVMDVEGADPVAIEEALLALAGQVGGVRWKLAVTGAGPDSKSFIRDVGQRIEWTTGQALKARGASLFIDDAAAFLSSIEAGETVIFAPASGVCAPDALVRLVEAMRPDEVLAAYGDEDSFDDAEGVAGEAAHHDPLFKPGFDPDLLAQIPYVGRLVAFAGAVLRKTGLSGAAGSLAPQDAILRAGLSPDQVGHVERVIFSRRASVSDNDAEQAQVWLSCVKRAYEGEPGVQVDPFTDILGVSLPGAVRVRRQASGSAAVLIPTKDNLDLLRPCIESIEKHREANQTLIEIIVIDHESSDPDTRTYLDDLQARGAARVLPFSGAFNWALMNNLAAAETQADVLVFLNNDTVVISPDWIDVLCSEARRPEIGVVGARLLYRDGAIQHAGFVWREAVSGFLVHDGVGAPGAEGGYMGRHALAHASIAVTGACMAVEASKFKELGGFDSASFPVEGNDVDLCLRAWNRNYRVLYAPGATLYHLESVTRGYSRDGEKRKVAARANARLLSRWGQAFARDRWFNGHFSRDSRPFHRLRPPR
ncbi:glycosyltransferase [Brevundimonas naejangsanensis]|uniref:glycosyltransferase n=1 Tax=Brevundimonas naejangsanensis TaxID=588932 RepID=UPI0026F005F2|nr:glycosyltransferase [Brevundimonas naejangsanensis]